MSSYADELQDRLKAHRANFEQELKRLREIDEQTQPDNLDSITKAEFSKLPLSEMQRLFDTDPDRVREILDSRPAYMDIIDPQPQPRNFAGTTAKEFKQMSVYDLQELYTADPELYSQLQAQTQEA